MHGIVEDTKNGEQYEAVLFGLPFGNWQKVAVATEKAVITPTLLINTDTCCSASGRFRLIVPTEA